jgi:hypothetical protein
MLYLAGVFWGAASAAVSCKLTVVFTDDGRTIVTVTPKSGSPVRYVWAAGSAVPTGPGLDARRLPDDELVSKSSLEDRVVRQVKTAIVLSKTGFRVLKTTLSSIAAALRQR